MQIDHVVRDGRLTETSYASGIMVSNMLEEFIMIVDESSSHPEH